ncbi:MAG TPA: endonuclease/exonuclease/phosphatase family protein [Kiloniellales bacterium]|nr:endonuclease/exonuclease/phosphatase family protein [Kiloniellales bacterium]
MAALLPSLGLGWRPDLFQHLRWHLLVLALPLLVLALFRRCWASAAALFLAVGLAGAPVAVAWTQLAPTAAADAPGTKLRVMTFNLAWTNGDLDTLEQEIAAADPDLLFLTEVADRHAPLIERLAARYPNRRSGLTDQFFGRLPLGAMQRITTEKYASLWVVESELGGRRLTILGGHPYPPIGDRWDRVNALWFSQARATLAGIEGPVILLGDLNATPWCERLRDLLHYGNLRRAGGWLGTWPTSLPGWAGIPIDQVLVSTEFAVAGRSTTSGAGSDHRALVVDLVLPD